MVNWKRIVEQAGGPETLDAAVKQLERVLNGERIITVPGWRIHTHLEKGVVGLSRPAGQLDGKPIRLFVRRVDLGDKEVVETTWVYARKEDAWSCYHCPVWEHRRPGDLREWVCRECPARL